MELATVSSPPTADLGQANAPRSGDIEEHAAGDSVTFVVQGGIPALSPLALEMAQHISIESPRVSSGAKWHLPATQTKITRMKSADRVVVQVGPGGKRQVRQLPSRKKPEAEIRPTDHVLPSPPLDLAESHRLPPSADQLGIQKVWSPIQRQGLFNETQPLSLEPSALFPSAAADLTASIPFVRSPIPHVSPVAAAAEREQPAQATTAPSTVRQKSSNSSPQLTPMAVLLSLEGFKTPGDGKHNRKFCNQDRGFIHEVSPQLTVFAVFDGHGEFGHEVAQFVSTTFQELLSRDFHQPATPAGTRLEDTMTAGNVLWWLRTNFSFVDKLLIETSKIDCAYSGCTASIAVRLRNAVYVAYVGDSKVAGFQFNGRKPYCLIETPEHSPSQKNEAARIQSLGATVSEQRYQYISKSISRIVEAGLSVSRAFGDLAARPYGLISVPDFVQIDIPKLSARPHHKTFPLMLIVASDGLWDTIAPYEVLDVVTCAQQPKRQLFESVKQLAEMAWRRRLAAEGRSDDTTVVMALLH